MYDVEMYTEYESLDLNEKYAAHNKGYSFLPMVREKVRDVGWHIYIYTIFSLFL